MEKKKPDFIIEIVGAEIVVGEITRWEKYSIHVITVSPYTGWEEHLLIMSFEGLRYYRDFRSDKGEGLARCALKTCYQKAKSVNNDIERLVRVYEQLSKELHEVSKIEDSEIRHRVKSKLEDWFFDVGVFSRLSTGLYANSYDRKKIYEILDGYLMKRDKV